MNFVTWKWRSPTAGRGFESVHVNVLRTMLARHYHGEHKLICLTDDTAGLDPRVEALPLPITGLEHLISPERPRRIGGIAFPACYRRLWLFSERAKELGERLVCLDIDCIILRDIAPLVEREESFVGWTDHRFEWNKVAGGIFMLRTGAHPEVWDDFDPVTSPMMAKAAGNRGSDQAWLSFKLYPPPGAWDERHGIIKINWTQPRRAHAPSGARIAFTSGARPPWHPDTRRLYPWVMHHWAL